MKSEKVLVMQIMGQTALVLRPRNGLFEIIKVGPNFTSVAKENQLVTLVEMALPVVPKGKK